MAKVYSNVSHLEALEREIYAIKNEYGLKVAKDCIDLDRVREYVKYIDCKSREFTETVIFAISANLYDLLRVFHDEGKLNAKNDKNGIRIVNELFSMVSRTSVDMINFIVETDILVDHKAFNTYLFSEACVRKKPDLAMQIIVSRVIEIEKLVMIRYTLNMFREFDPIYHSIVCGDVRVLMCVLEEYPVLEEKLSEYNILTVSLWNDVDIGTYKFILDQFDYKGPPAPITRFNSLISIGLEYAVSLTCRDPLEDYDTCCEGRNVVSAVDVSYKLDCLLDIIGDKLPVKEFIFGYNELLKHINNPAFPFNKYLDILIDHDKFGTLDSIEGSCNVTKELKLQGNQTYLNNIILLLLKSKYHRNCKKLRRGVMELILNLNNIIEGSRDMLNTMLTLEEFQEYNVFFNSQNELFVQLIVLGWIKEARLLIDYDDLYVSTDTCLVLNVVDYLSEEEQDIKDFILNRACEVCKVNFNFNPKGKKFCHCIVDLKDPGWLEYMYKLRTNEINKRL